MTAHGHEGHGLVAVGPGLAAPALAFPPFGVRPVSPLAVRAERIRRPPLRSDTLSRPRLNAWLDRAAGGRLAIVSGEAGFGKTTLLADWAERSQRRTAWYRLEHDDRDWLTFVRHLIAGGRELDPEFAPESYRLLCALGPGGPTQDELTRAVGRDMASFGAADPRGFSLVLDDFQEIEACEETDPVVAALLGATGDGFSLIIAARSAPVLPPARWRSRSGVHRLDGDQLRFDLPETEALFRCSYGIPLEHEVAAELATRTEGWPALLSLVRTRLEERSDPDPRALVAQLSATAGDLYDFLADEVLVDLPGDLQEFLMRVSILSEVDLRGAQLVDHRGSDAIEASISEAETMGFLSAFGRDSARRFHPLVRDFLAAKLEAKIGTEALREQHRAIADALEPLDWRASASHYRAAGASDAAARVVDEAIPSIIGSGSFEAALPLLDGTAGSADRAGALILRSRIEFSRGNLRRALALAEEAASKADASLTGTALLNIAALEEIGGFPEYAIQRTESALRGPLADPERQVAEASLLMRRSQTDGDLAEVADGLRQLANRQEFEGLTRYAAISHLNLANVLNWLGDPSGAVKAAVRAEISLTGSPQAVERTAAMAARALALTHLRKWAEADLVMRLAHSAASPLARLEADLETAQLEAMYGSVVESEKSLERVDLNLLPRSYFGLRTVIAANIALRRNETSTALELGETGREYGLLDVAGRFRTDLLLLRTRMAVSDPTIEADAESLVRLAAAQGSRPGSAIAVILMAMVRGGRLASEVSCLAADDRHVLSLLAEEISHRLADLSPAASEVVADEAAARPARWSSALRQTASGAGPSRLPAARLLSGIGDAQDVAFLRTLARTSKPMRQIAAGATRRLAPRVHLRDLGVIRLVVGTEPGVATSRRKPLALLCFLASRPRLAATRDEALEALWPDFSPETANNSLHQAIYFLRRIFDAEYREGISAPYLTFDGEVLTLDPDLFESDSNRCWRMLRSTGSDDREAAREILSLYQGRFAMDFMYEDWSTDYRETLHAGVLGRIEAAMSSSLAAGDAEGALYLGTSILAIDPDADAIELALLRAYKAAGRPAAAAEQYAHYAAVLRDELGIDPPALADL